jgi:MFS family permease
VAVSGAVPAVVVGLWGSPQVDRLNRQSIIVVSAVVSTVVRAVLLVLLPVGWEHLGIAAVMVIAFVSGSLGAVERPALLASLSTLFGDSYQDFIGKRSGLSFLTQAVAPAVGGGAVGLIGSEATIIACGVGYAEYALLIATIRGFDPTYVARSTLARARSASVHHIEGLRFAWTHPALRGLFVYWFFSIMAVPLGVMAALPYITHVLGRSALEYGIASSCYGVAPVVGSVLAGKARLPGSARRWMLASGLVYGGVNLAMGLCSRGTSCSASFGSPGESPTAPRRSSARSCSSGPCPKRCRAGCSPS